MHRHVLAAAAKRAYSVFHGSLHAHMHTAAVEDDNMDDLFGDFAIDDADMEEGAGQDAGAKAGKEHC